MIKFAMIVLTLLTVLGSAMLGWLARRYALGGRCEPFGSDELAKSLPEGSGLAAGAIGTVAAGTAAMRYAEDGSESGPSGSASAGSTVTGSAKFSSGTGADTLKGEAGGSAPRADANGSDVSDVAADLTSSTSASSLTASSHADTSGKAEWFDGDADASGSTSENSSALAATAAGTAGAVGAATKLVSGSGAGADASTSGEAVSNLSDQDMAARSGVGSGDDASGASSTSGGGDSATGPAASAGAGLVADGRSAGVDDEEDDGVALVDIPSSLSAEEAEAERLLASDEAIAAPTSRLDAPRSNQSPDDLTKIKGIGPKINGQLNDRGIYYYDQIADFSGSDLAWADRELGFKGRAVRDRWIPQARGLMDASALDGPSGGNDTADVNGVDGAGSTASSHSGAATSAGLTGTGVAAGGMSAGADDEEDGGVALVDVPSSLSAEEAEAERLLASDEAIAAPTSRLDAPRSNQSPDDLTKIKGIGPKINGQLNDRGIYYYDQIADFSGSDLAWADRELGFKGRAVRDRWIPQARGLMDASALDDSADSSNRAQSAELTASEAEVRQLRTRLGLNPDSGSSANNLGKSDAERLEASQQEARELRQQLWTKEEAEKVNAGSASSSVSGAGTSTAVATAADAGSFGALSSEEAEAEKLIASGSAPKTVSNRLDEPTPGFDPDDLTKIRGIGKPTQSRLNRNGIYYYDQIAGFTAADLAWADKTMNLDGRVVSDRWIPQAKALAGETEGHGSAAGGAGLTTAAGFADLSDDDESGAEDEILVDVPSGLTEEEAEAERLLASGEEIAPPASRLDAPQSGRAPDDLTKIKGIGPKINSKLNDQGIYYYDQIAGFKGSDLAWADRELDFKGRAVRDRWVPQARGLVELSSSAGTPAAAPKTLLDKPIEGESPDDLTEIKGIGAVLQTQLNEKGIYYYSQIAEFSDSDQEWANQTLGFPGRVERDDWIPQAKELAAGRATRRNVLSNAGKQLGALSENEAPGEMSGDESEAMRLIESGSFVADDSNRPTSLLQSASNGPADDLQQIKGVGPKLNTLLNSLGIYYFRQIADFSATDIAWVDSKLQFKGRIVRDRWVDQAKRLS